MVRFQQGKHQRVGYFDADRPAMLLDADADKSSRKQLVAEGIFSFLDYDKVFHEYTVVYMYKFAKKRVIDIEAERVMHKILRVIENKQFDLELISSKPPRRPTARGRRSATTSRSRRPGSIAARPSDLLINLSFNIFDKPF